MANGSITACLWLTWSKPLHIDNDKAIKSLCKIYN